MSTHSLLRAVAACASGRRVVVSVPSGKVYALPTVQLPASPEPPNALEVLSRELLARDTEIRASVEAVNARTAAALAAVKDAVEDAVQHSTNEIVGTLHLPVKPVYFPDGKLKHAQRVKEA